MNVLHEGLARRAASLCAVLVALIATPGVAHGGGGAAQSWMARWNLAEAGTTNRVLGMKADREGNLLIAGDLTETNGSTRYSLLKYTPEGRLLWATGYASVEFPPNEAKGFDLDREGNVVMTGRPDSVKFSHDGRQLWVAAYGGKDVAVDRDGNALVTGWHDTRISTVKLAPSGSNLWTGLEFDFPDFAQYPQFTSYSQKVAVNEAGEFFVAGFEVFDLYIRSDPWSPRWRFALYKYDGQARRLWKYIYPEEGNLPLYTRTLYGLAATSKGGALVTSDEAAILLRIAANGTKEGRAYAHVGTTVSAIDTAGNVYGAVNYTIPDETGYLYGVYRTGKILMNGEAAWIAEFSDGSRIHAERVPRAVCLDGRGVVMVAGVAPRPESRGDIVSVAYDTETGRELWVRRYNGPTNGQDEPWSMVSDHNANIYIAGTSQNAAGGVDVVLIKYTAVKPVQREGASIEVQFPGPVGEPLPVEVSSNLLDWSPLATVQADAAGIARYTDSNVIQTLPARFYRPGK